jgi:hypothetical protein
LKESKHWNGSKKEGEMVRLVLIATVAAVAALGAIPASAQTVCGDRGKLVAYLGKGHKESRTGIGVAANGSVIELYTAETGTWTMLMTMPGGPTCVTGSGEG